VTVVRGSCVRSPSGWRDRNGGMTIAMLCTRGSLVCCESLWHPKPGGSVTHSPPSCIVNRILHFSLIGRHGLPSVQQTSCSSTFIPTKACWTRRRHLAPLRTLASAGLSLIPLPTLRVKLCLKSGTESRVFQRIKGPKCVPPAATFRRAMMMSLGSVSFNR
jgi:hypothetical protein